MREMKDSGIEWIGEIPTHWEIAKLKYLTKTREENGLFYPKVASYIGLENIVGYSNDIYYTDTDYEVSVQSICKREDVLFGKLRPYLAKVILAPFDSFCSSEFLVFSEFTGDRRFLRFCLLNKKLIDNINSSTYGAKMPRVSSDYILNLMIAFPPLSEQHHIASFLDAKCAEIDALTADIQAQIDVLEQYKRSVITETVTKGLNPDAEMKDSGIEWIGRIPAHWDVMPNKYIMHKEKNICPIYQGEDILSLTMNGVIVRDLDAGGKMPKTFDGYQKIRKGNLLMCLFDIDVTPRCIGIINNDGLTSPAYSQFVLHSNATANYYYYYYLMLDFTKELLHMAKNLRHSLTEEQLGTIQVPVPPVSEQIAIADYLNVKCAEIDEIIDQKREQISTIEEYKKSLIFEYVTGKKEV